MSHHRSKDCKFETAEKLCKTCRQCESLSVAKAVTNWKPNLPASLAIATASVPTPLQSLPMVSFLLGIASVSHDKSSSTTTTWTSPIITSTCFHQHARMQGECRIGSQQHFDLKALVDVKIEPSESTKMSLTLTTARH